MTAQCLRCQTPSNTTLCTRCTQHTRNTLRGLPRILRHLAEAATGQTQLGDIGRHTPYRHRHELHGDTELAAHIEPLPPRNQYGHTCDTPDNPDDDDPTDLYESRRARQQTALRAALAAGGVNERASTLHATITDTLTTWTQDIADTHQLDTTHLKGTTDMCVWLAHHIHHIANHPAADELTDELDHHTRHALRILNRPTPPRYIGPCPTPLDATHNNECDHHHPHPCGTALQAHRHATTTCPQCHTTHTNLDKLSRESLDIADAMWCQKPSLLFYLAAIGTPATDPQIRQWCRRRQIRQRTLPDGTPEYSIGDARIMAARATLSQNSSATAIPKSGA